MLLEAGIERARGLISAVDSDEANLSITITARALNPELVIVARAARLESIDKLRRAGADRVASSDALGGIWIAFLALRPAVPEFFEMVTVSPDLAFEEILVRSGSPLVGKTVRETRLAYAESVILAIRRDGDDLRPFPSDDAILAPGDLAIVAGPVGSIEAMAG